MEDWEDEWIYLGREGRGSQRVSGSPPSALELQIALHLAGEAGGKPAGREAPLGEQPLVPGTVAFPP